MIDWFENPIYLWLILAFLPFAVWDGLRRWAAGRRRQLFGVAVRVLLLAAIAVALAQPRLEREERVADVVFLLDRSASVPDSLLERAMERIEGIRATFEADEKAGLVLFDGRPEVAVYPGDEWSAPTVLRQEAVDETNLGMALQVALGLIPQDHAGRIVLLSDARPTQGDTTSALEAAERRGIPIWTIPIQPGFADPAITAIDLDAPSFNPGETISGEVGLRGGPADVSGTLVLTLGDETISESAVTLAAGEVLTVPFEYSPETALAPGLVAVRAQLVPDDPTLDDQPANNALSAGVNISDHPAVLIVAHDASEVSYLRDMLEAEEMRVTIFFVAEFEAADVDLSEFDLLILANAPAESTEEEPVLSTESIEEIRRYVSSGGGLITLGGDRSYELGGYGQTALATVLPIELQPRDPELEPAVTIIMILDNSGSMGTWAEGGTKMDLANAGAAAAMHLLRPFDRLGVMAVDDRVDWVVNMQRAEDKERLERAIRGIPVGGGGIYVYTSLREAYRQMRTVDTPLRHVLLFSDAADSEEQVSGIIFGWGAGPNSYDLARSMRTEGITVSVIGIGSEWDQDVNFLRNLADAGGGRFYLTERASELESLFVEETQRLVDSVLNEAPFRVRSISEHPATEGLEFRRSPRLRGLIELEARETAQVVLAHPDGHPVLTTWRYGLGQVAALAIDAGPRWAGPWLDWDGYGVLWSQLSRWALRRHEGDDTAVEVAFGESVATVTVARRSSQGLTEIEGGVRAILRAEDGDAPGSTAGVPLELRIIEPGLWEAELETEPGRRYTLTIQDSGEEVFAEHSFVSPPSLEFRFDGADVQRLQELSQRTQGGYDPQDDEVRGELATLTHFTPLWLYFLCGALLLMPIDAFLRRPGRDA